MTRIEMAPDFYDQTPDGNVLATEAMMNTMRTADLILDRIARLLRPFDVTPAGGLVLGILRDRGTLSPSEIGERLIVSRATVTGVVDSLERRGYVRRTAHPVDRRSLLVEITPTGRDVLQAVRTLVHRHERDWLAGVSEADLRAYVAMLHRIQDSLTTTPQSP